MRPPRDARSRPIRVLVVDDHPIVRKGLVDLFSETPGLQVVGAIGAVTPALGAVARYAPDVTVVDLSLGAERGLGLVATLVSRQPGLRVLALSGLDDPAAAQRALAAGALGFVTTDRAEGDLVAAVRRVADGRPWVSAETTEWLLGRLGPNRRAVDASPIDRLSGRERHVFGLVAQGLATREIAARLGLSVKTVESHYAHLKAKLGAKHLRDLTRIAVSWTMQPRRPPISYEPTATPQARSR